MKIAFVIYDGMTALDFIGVYDPVTRLKTMGFIPDLAWEVCARFPEVRDITGLVFKPTQVGGSLEGFDMIIVPGGFGSREPVQDDEFLAWLKTGAAGFLTGRAATTHPTAFDRLRKYAASVRHDRIVDEGDVITARGVTSAIDLGLYLAEKLAGPGVRERIRQQMDYEDRT